MKKIIISPPFGNYIDLNCATSVKGTYTWERRPGLVRQAIKTIRPIRGGYLNAIGFRNKGIRNVELEYGKKYIYSVAALHPDEWAKMCPHLALRQVELNVGCPNVGKYGITEKDISDFATLSWRVQIKVPPTENAFRIIDMGINYLNHFHIANAMPTPRGGESGYRLKKQVLPLIEKAKKTYKGIRIIGGGGIYTSQDVMDYYNSGVDFYSLSTIFFTPWKVPAVIRAIESLPE